MDLKIISIIFILSSTDVYVENRTIFKSCQDWWKENAIILPKTNHKRMENRYVILINHRPVMGYICRG